jgi:selenide,water dikinase
MLLYGANIGDDAGVYKLRDDLALVQTVDFFTPVVDDPYLFGQIAAANALSDVYTMGATPITALNIISYPCRMGMERLALILRGGLDKVKEAGAVIIGGHSIDDTEPKYGLAVTGLVEPRKMITNQGAKPGQKIVLTKKLGTGIIVNMRKLSSGLKGRIRGLHPLSEAVFLESIESMTTLNARAAELMLKFGCTACTDVTGFGLLGHAKNVAEASGVALEIRAGQVPRFDGVWEVAIEGTAGGSRRNREYVEGVVQRDHLVTEQDLCLFSDAQTSGGLLMTVDADKAEPLISALKAQGHPAAAIIGEVHDGPAGTIFLKS